MADGENEPNPGGGFQLYIRRGLFGTVFKLSIDGKMVLGAVALAAIYFGTPEDKGRILSILGNVLQHWSMTVRNGTMGSLIVELCCHSPESFLQFLDDFELGNVGIRLSDEFSKIGFEEVTVEIQNEEEVLRQRDVIR